MSDHVIGVVAKITSKEAGKNKSTANSRKKNISTLSSLCEIIVPSQSVEEEDPPSDFEGFLSDKDDSLEHSPSPTCRSASAHRTVQNKKIFKTIL